MSDRGASCEGHGLGRTPVTATDSASVLRPTSEGGAFNSELYFQESPDTSGLSGSWLLPL